MSNQYFTMAYNRWKRDIDDGIEKNSDTLRSQRNALNRWIDNYQTAVKEKKINAEENLAVCMNTRDKMDAYLETLSDADRVTYELL